MYKFIIFVSKTCNAYLGRYNSFISFVKFSFYENEPVARIIRDLAKKTISEKMEGSPPWLLEGALMAADVTYEKTKEGYTLISSTWLYKLRWNDTTLYTVYDIWDNPSVIDNADLFSLEFVGTQSNSSIVTTDLKGIRTEAQTIDVAVVRNVDNVFSKLQKKHEVFKPLTPVYSVNPITAQIGKKESLKGGEKFEVLELTMNLKTGETEYKKVGTITLDKKRVWDNRYNAGEEINSVTYDKKGNPVHGSIFKGSKKIQPGMLIRQIK